MVVALGQEKWPWDVLDEANRRYADASRHELEAGVREEVSERERAAAEKWQAMTDRQTIREELTRLSLGSLRIALQEQPLQLRALLVEAVGPEQNFSGHVKDAFAEVFRRLDQLEGGRR